MNILKNSFHNTSYATTKSNEELEVLEFRIIEGKASEAEKAFVRKVRRVLCGSKDCKCGDYLKRRP